MIDLKLKTEFKDFALNIDTKLDDGLIYGVYGPSGSGKSTLLNSLAGYLSHEHNTLIYNKKDLIADHKEIHIAYVDQEITLIPHMSISQQLTFFSKYSEDEKNELIKYFSIEAFLNQKPGTLSGGQLQRVSICLAILSKANLLLLDEAFSNMDTMLKREYREKLKNVIHENKILTFIVSHDLADIYNLAEYIIELKLGKIKKITSMKDSFERALDLNKEFVVKGEIINMDDQYYYFYSGNLINKISKDQKSGIKIGDLIEISINDLTNQIKIL